MLNRITHDWREGLDDDLVLAPAIAAWEAELTPAMTANGLYVI